jgi:LacI family transcriptional regulator
MQTTIRDIARELNLSHTTVSRVLNGKGEGFISAETRQRVLEMVAKMNYRPHRAARALATGQSGMVALWLEDFRLPYFVNVMNHMTAQLQAPAYDLLIHAMGDLNAAATTVAQWQVDGILALDGALHVRRVLEADLPLRPPIVSLGDFPVTEVDHVGVDLYTGATAAVRHLIDVGCRRIAYFTNAWGNRSGERRYDAYTAVMQQAGREPIYIVTPDNDRKHARQTIREHVTAHGCPDGLFCLSDSIAVGVYRGLRDLGIRIPEDIALVGCDGIEDVEYLDCPLTTIVQPFDEMCAVAWQFLQQRMADPGLPLQRRILVSQLVVRESSRR